MTRHRRVETGTWNDRKFRELSRPQPNGQTLWLYLLCGQRTTIFPGLVTATEVVIASDLKWPLDAIAGLWKELADRGMAEADWGAGVIVLPRALLDSAGKPRETSRPSSPNAFRGWAKAWPDVPECDLKDWYLAELGRFVEVLDAMIAAEKGPQKKTYKDAYLNAFATSLERVRERVGDSRARAGAPAPTRARSPVPVPVPVPDSDLDPDPGSSTPAYQPPTEPPGDRDHGVGAESLGRVGGPLAHEPAGLPNAAVMGVRARQGLVDRFRDAIGKARAEAAARHGLQGVRVEIPLHGGENETELRQRLRDAGDRAEAELEHVIAVATAAAMRDPKNVQWLGWNLGRSRSWERALRTTPELESGQSRSVFDAVDAAVAKLERAQEDEDGHDPE